MSGKSESMIRLFEVIFRKNAKKFEKKACFFLNLRNVVRTLMLWLNKREAWKNSCAHREQMDRRASTPVFSILKFYWGHVIPLSHYIYVYIQCSGGIAVLLSNDQRVMIRSEITQVVDTLNILQRGIRGARY